MLQYAQYLIQGYCVDLTSIHRYAIPGGFKALEFSKIGGAQGTFELKTFD